MTLIQKISSNNDFEPYFYFLIHIGFWRIFRLHHLETFLMTTKKTSSVVLPLLLVFALILMPMVAGNILFF